MEMQFLKLRKRSEEEGAELVARFNKRNARLSEHLEAIGVTLEYDSERDYLYMTFGDVPSPGVAIFLGLVIAMADPDTLEAVGLEVPFFMEKVNSGELNQFLWKEIAKIVRRHNKVYLPPTGQGEALSVKKIGQLLPV